MRALSESIFILRSNDGSLPVSDTSHAPIEVAGRLSDAYEPRQDDYATSGGKERMTGAEHEPIMTDPAQDGQVGRRRAAHDDRPQSDPRDPQLRNGLAVAPRARQRARSGRDVDAVGQAVRRRQLERAQLSGQAVLGAF